MNKELFDKLTKGNFYTRLFNYMNEVGLNRIIVQYSGGGDSGGMDEMAFLPALKNESIENSIKSELEDELSQPIYNRHGGFADGGGYSVNGSVIWDAQKKQVWIEGVDHYYEYGEDGDESGSSDEEWHESVYSQEDDEKIYDERDYLFAYLYSKDVLNAKLPEEFHNMILLEATSGDESAKRYIKNFK
jgi:hypothetical protein